MKKIKNNKTKIILLSKIRGLGKPDIYSVAKGYARYLINSKFAVKYSEEKLSEINNLKNKVKNYDKECDEIVSLLQNKELFFEKQSNELGGLFDSIRENDIIQYINSNFLSENIELQNIFKNAKTYVNNSRNKAIIKTGVYEMVIDLYNTSFSIFICVGRNINEIKNYLEEFKKK